jgi:hypothetical protein
MALTIKALNNDTSFFLIFTPPIAPKKNKRPEQFPGAFTILIDPWLSGPAQIIGRKFSHQEHPEPACISSLQELPEPDLVLISQSQPDHCHEKTLCEFSPDTPSLILGTPGAIKKVRSWKHFDDGNIDALKPYSWKKKESVYRIEIPSFSPSGSSGEVTIALLEPKRDLTGVHNAIGITYRPPYCVLSMSTSSYIDLPITPNSLPSSPNPLTPTSSLPSPRIISSRANTIYPSPYNNMEKTISVLYSPHGVPYSTIAPWVSTHLIREAALPLLGLIHSFTQVDMPWYLGGNMATGSPGGIEIARNLMPKVWIGAHDEKKMVKGMMTRGIERLDFEAKDIGAILGDATEVLTLDAGMEVRVDTSGGKLEPKVFFVKEETKVVEKEKVVEEKRAETSASNESSDFHDIGG